MKTSLSSVLVGICITFVSTCRAEVVALPNIVVIMVDDLGYGDLGCYGQQQIRTPNLDRMAAEGMKFTDFYAGSTVCAPSRCVLMTGLHTGHAQIRGNYPVRPMGQYPLSPETPTVARLLQKAGYATGLVGKWGLGGPDSTGIPSLQGFDFFYGYLCQRHAHNFYPEFLFRNSQREPLAGNRVAEPLPDGSGVAIERAQYSHNLLTNEALAFLDRHAAQQKEDPTSRPFFLCLTPTIPHANSEAGEKGMEVPDHGIYEDRDWPEPEKGRAAMISLLDADVGRILQRIRKHGIDDRTLVIFTSDNGPADDGGSQAAFFTSSGPLRGIKRDLYEGGIRVPMIARWPGKIAAASESAHLCYLGDVFATLAELADSVPTSGLDSVSFAPTLFGNTERQQNHPYLYWEFYEQGSAQAVRNGQWKAVRQPMITGPIELYDLNADLAEQHDVAADHPGIVVQMQKAMGAAHTPSPLWKPKGSRIQ